MSLNRHARGVAVPLAVAALACGGSALAQPSKAQCVAANEDAQGAQRSSKLREARRKLLACTDKACPGPVRDDCAARLRDVDRAMPTIIFHAKTASGAPLRAVTVRVDGERVADSLDDTAIALDPGDHTFDFESDGLPRTNVTLTLREGIKDREENRGLRNRDDATGRAAVVVSGIGWISQRTIGLVLGGAGVVGLVVGTIFGLKARGTYNDALTHCPSGPASCDDSGVTGGADAHSQATISTVAFVAGVALAAGGAILYFTAPGGGSVSVGPTASGASVRAAVSW